MNTIEFIWQRLGEGPCNTSWTLDDIELLEGRPCWQREWAYGRCHPSVERIRALLYDGREVLEVLS